MTLEDQLKQFKCQQCNKCCRQPGFVYLEPSEAEQIADFLNLDVYQFNAQYCDLHDKQRLVLKKNSDESCIF